MNHALFCYGGQLLFSYCDNFKILIYINIYIVIKQTSSNTERAYSGPGLHASFPELDLTSHLVQPAQAPSGQSLGTQWYFRAACTPLDKEQRQGQGSIAT